MCNLKLHSLQLRVNLHSKTRFPFADNFKAEFSAGFVQSDWLLKQQRFERKKSWKKFLYNFQVEKIRPPKIVCEWKTGLKGVIS